MQSYARISLADGRAQAVGQACTQGVERRACQSELGTHRRAGRGLQAVLVLLGRREVLTVLLLLLLAADGQGRANRSQSTRQSMQQRCAQQIQGNG